ncbi:MAG: hypothetical protein CVV45_21290, partial [Spirochaetae bacterium HGW-Spirochaetae-10]
MRINLFVAVALSFPTFVFNAEPLQAFERPVIDPDKWLTAFTPFIGTVKNSTDLQFRTYRDGTGGLDMIRGSKSVSGTGNGGGYQIQTVKKGWSAMHLSFVFPMFKNDDSVALFNGYQQVKTEVTGTVFALQYRFDGEWVRPFVGIHYFQGIGPHDRTVVDRMLFKNEVGEGIASIDRVAVDVQVYDPVAQAGIQIKIPIQNWSLSLFHGYGMERVRTVIDASTGRLLADDLTGLSSSILEYGQVGPGALIPARMQINRNYHSHRPGFALYMDYRRFISLRLQARR